MAYINVAEWKPDQITEWITGLDHSMKNYVKSFTNNQVGGQQLLNIRPYELEQLGMYSIGHQEIVLEAVEHLRNFHYHLDKENLQFLALHVATSASCLYKQLNNHHDKSKLATQILNDVTRTIITIKPIVAWLDRSPFHGQLQFSEIRKQILKLGIELATIAQRDRFVFNPVEQLRTTAEKLANLANYIIQDISDPMILQPASLDLVTLKKRESELGFYIVPSYHGVLRITDIKFNSPAHNSGKIEEGDEIVQINYQTVVGWQYNKVIMQLQESPPDVLLTLKKRPKHTKIYGQIYMKPYRLPSKKHFPYRWAESLPSPRLELNVIQDYQLPLKRVPEKNVQSDSDSSSSSDIMMTPSNIKTSNKDLRLYLPKPRAVLQRRNTICGDHVTNFKSFGNLMLLQEHKTDEKDEESPSLRDKSISFGFGLELTQRPTTCLGITTTPGAISTTSTTLTNGTNNNINKFNVLKLLPEIQQDKCKTATIDEENLKTDHDPDDVNNPNFKIKHGVSKVVRFDSNMKLEEQHIDTKYTCNVDNTVLETFEPIPYVDDEIITLPPLALEPSECFAEKKLNVLPDLVTSSQKVTRMSKETGLVEAVNTVVVNREIVKRGKLDKSYSTPAYDSELESDIPPAIEPRQEFLNKTPPAPPPRPKKFIDNISSLQINTTTSQPIHLNNKTELNNDENKSKIATVIDLKKTENCQNIVEILNQTQINERSSTPNGTEIINPRYTPATTKKLPPIKHFREERFEALELLTPNKTKSLTLKKKNSILAKRRKLTLKILGTSDIQGHLYRRSKDKHGVTYWAKLYFVLIDAALYGFKLKESTKADCLIFLTGFTVSLANEVHSKSYAFKVYHPLKTFYFAAETQEALAQWIEYIRQATIKGNPQSVSTSTPTDKKIKELYTETESSSDEFDDTRTRSKFGNQSSSQQSFSTNSKQNQCKGVNDSESPSSTKHEKYHLAFGSLKKFTKSNLPFSSNKSNEKKSQSSEVPIPTAQFRSYRKVPGNAGLQLGTNSMTSQSIDITSTLSPQQPSSITDTTNFIPVQHHRKISISSFQNYDDDDGDNNDIVNDNHKDNDNKLQEIKMNLNKTKKSHNYMHASNPNLVEFDFQTSRALDFSLPKINPANSWDCNINPLQGFVTLKDLMLQKQAEDAQEMYNNRVYLGVEKDETKHLILNNKNIKSEKNNKENYTVETVVVGGVKQNILKIQRRSLPKTPDYAQSFKPDDKDIIMARSKEGQKLRDFGYEFISGDDSNENKSHLHSAENLLRRNDRVSPASGLVKKGINWISSDRKQEEEKSSRQGSLKKAKNTLKASSEKLFQFKHSFNEKDSLKLNPKHVEKSTFIKPMTTSYSPSTLPLNKKSSHLVNLENFNASHSNIKKTNSSSGQQSMNNDIIIENPRKNSAPERGASYLTKLTFATSKSSKERKLLGSPRLHRAFGRAFGRSASHSEGQNIDHEIFSPITSPNTSTDRSNVDSNPINQQLPLSKTSSNSSTLGSPDYPNLQYPPVFEPETYSISANTTTLLRQRNNNNNQNK